jgi:hypothetical protein
MSVISCPDIGMRPNQPRNMSFPLVEFGKKKLKIS